MNLLQTELIHSNLAQLLKTPVANILELEVLTEINSTNDYLKKILNIPNKIHFCLAEQQTSGRGRLGKTWHSPFGANIYLSGSWFFPKNNSELSGLSLVVGLSVINALHHYGVREKIQLKWPNDILWRGRKLAGILIETHSPTPEHLQIIIGIGLNINMPNVSIAEINQPWVSLHEILGNPQDRNQITAHLIHQLLEHVSFFKQHGLRPFLDQWQIFDALWQQEITLIHGQQEIHGKAVGINHQGHLLLQQQDGSVKAYSSGDTTIKKLLKNY